VCCLTQYNPKNHNQDRQTGIISLHGKIKTALSRIIIIMLHIFFVCVEKDGSKEWPENLVASNIGSSFKIPSSTRLPMTIPRSKHLNVANSTHCEKKRRKKKLF